MRIGKKIIDWYKENGRKMPWRETQDPYKIWISEVIMQQTRIAQGTEYYNRFVERFPTIADLANAEIDDVLKYWEGLGYYSRARNLHSAAKQLMTEFGEKFPTHYSEIIKLKGIGPYSARAIGSFAFGNSTGVIDGNVLRIMSRILNDFSPIDSPSTRNKFQIIIDEWVKDLDSSPFNQGIMDIGSTICTPTQASCLLCHLESDCLARKEGSVSLLPIKAKKLQRKTAYFHFYILKDEKERFAILRRPEKGLWGGLYEIPNEEVSEELWQEKTSRYEGRFLGAFKHIFTHFDMELQVYEINHRIENPNILYVSKEELSTYAFSRAVLKIFEKFIS